MLVMDKVICFLYIEVKNIYCKGNNIKQLGDKYLKILLIKKKVDRVLN